MSVSLPHAYQTAIDELAAAYCECQELAAILDYFGRQLRGDVPDTEGPPLEMYPQPHRVRRALERLDRAVVRSVQEWQRLPGELQTAGISPWHLTGPWCD